MKHVAQWCSQQRTGPSLGRFPSQLWKIYSTPPNGKRERHLLLSSARDIAHSEACRSELRYRSSHHPFNGIGLSALSASATITTM